MGISYRQRFQGGVKKGFLQLNLDNHRQKKNYTKFLVQKFSNTFLNLNFSNLFFPRKQTP